MLLIEYVIWLCLALCQVCGVQVHAGPGLCGWIVNKWSKQGRSIETRLPLITFEALFNAKKKKGKELISQDFEFFSIGSYTLKLIF